MSGEIEWPREIWMAERDDHDQGVVSAVLSEHATVARFEGDRERDREFHRYVDADIYETAQRYWRARVAAAYEAAASYANEQADAGADKRRFCASVKQSAYLRGLVVTARDIADSIRDLTPADAKAALEAVRREARNEALREAAEIADFYIGPEMGSLFYQGINSGCRAIRGRIRTLIDKETTE